MKKFKVGDKVITDEGRHAVIIDIDENDICDFNPWYGIRYEDDSETVYTEAEMEIYKSKE